MAIAFLCGVSSSASSKMIEGTHATNKTVSVEKASKKALKKQATTIEAADQAKADALAESENGEKQTSGESAPASASENAQKASSEVQSKADTNASKVAAASTPAASSEAQGGSQTLSSTSQATTENENIVYLSITGVDDEVNILEKQKVSFNDGDSVFDVLLRETKMRKIQMEFSGLPSSAYIKGIDNLYEFDKGEGSGWLYSVNGKFPKESCSSYKLKKGDSIAWKYTKDSGKDIGAN